ncbi:N-acetyltransferase family protein [Alsobacter sp. R-9]
MGEARAADILIRDMTVDDRPAVAALLLALNRHEDRIAGDRFVAEEAGWACLAEDEAWITGHGGAILVATDASGVAGVLVLCFDSAETFLRPDLRPHGLVADLVVAERARSRGIGRLLLAEAEKRTRAAGLAAMHIHALVGNDPSLRLYEDVGFRRQSIELVKRF